MAILKSMAGFLTGHLCRDLFYRYRDLYQTYGSKVFLQCLDLTCGSTGIPNVAMLKIRMNKVGEEKNVMIETGGN